MHKIALVLASAAVGEGLISLHLVRQLHAERETAQTLQARVSELERGSQQRPAGATFVAVPTQPAASPFTVGGQSKPTQAAPAGGTTITTVNAVVPPNAGPPDQQQMREQFAAQIERQRTLMRDPEYREAMHAQHKMSMVRSNPDVVKDLNLTAGQADRLFDTLADQQLRATENAPMWGEQPDPAKMQEMHRKAMEQMSANEAELRSVLGDAKYREWQEYQGMAGVRWEATRLRTALANAGVPLEPDLAKPLMKVLQEQQKLEEQRLQQYAATQVSPASARVGFFAASNGDNVVKFMTNSVESLTESQRRQRDALTRVLTPEQLRVIEDEHDAELQMQRVQLQLMRAQQKAGGLDPTMNGMAVRGFVEQGVTVVPASD